MDPEVKAKLDQALDAKRRSDAAKSSAEDQRKAKMRKSVDDFTALLDSMILPALDGIVDYLKDGGVRAYYERGRGDTFKPDPPPCPDVTLYLNNGAYITIECDTSAGYVRFPNRSVPGESPSGFNNIRIEDLTTDKVQSNVVEFISKVLKRS